MRQRFEQQINLRTVAIADIKFPLKSRDELPPVLKALQYIFITRELNEKIFVLLESKICSGKKKTGRKGMDLWHILVLAVVRHTLNTNWDRLELIANYDQLIREVLGVHTTGFSEDKIEFPYQSIIDNVQLIDEELLYQINLLVVESGQTLIKKKAQEDALRLKTDSYVLEANIHFPTDLNLLYDSLRKSLDMIAHLRKDVHLEGWRKIKQLGSSIKSTFRSTSQQVFRGKKEDQKIQSVKYYLHQSNQLVQRFEEVINNQFSFIKTVSDRSFINISVLIGELRKYKDYAVKFIDQIERRLLKKEVIAASEKIYSIFEPHTEWISKGKQNKKVELGHMVLVTTDQNHFIIDYKVMLGEKDPGQMEGLTQRIQHNFPSKKIYSHSFDKGFYSKDNVLVLQNAGIEEVILPKRGRLNEQQKEREHSKKFVQLRHAHSAVESNINMLEHHGLNRCMNKGLHGFKKCVGLSVLAYNLHILGNCLTAQQKQKLQKEQKSRLRKEQKFRQAA